jgi:hypothetical protein
MQHRFLDSNQLYFMGHGDLMSLCRWHIIYSTCAESDECVQKGRGTFVHQVITTQRGVPLAPS